MFAAEDAALSSVEFAPVAFRDLPGWASDDHAAVVDVLKNADMLPDADAPFAQQAPRAYFEARYVPHRVQHDGPDGLLTGYYEPILRGSRTRSEAYPIPLYRKPDDLVKLHGDIVRGARNSEFVAGRVADGVLVPYFTRAEIESGALAFRNLELLFLADPIDAFFLHVQGSGLVEFEDGTRTRVGYAAKNGHPYTSIGRVLIERGIIPSDQMSLEALRAWLQAHPEDAPAVLQENKSFIFFSDHGPPATPPSGPAGSLGIPLTTGRSLAVDPSYHTLGTPIFVSSETLTCAGDEGFHRLMVAQDVGSAIRGPERGDIFWGTGDEAGRLAGETIHRGVFFVLLPRGGPGDRHGGSD